MKRSIVHFVIFFLLGAVINIAVAWYWILFVPFDINTMYFSMPDESDKIKNRLPEYVFVRNDLFEFRESGMMNRGYELFNVFGTEIDRKGIDSAVPLVMMCKAGWPIYSFEGKRIMSEYGFEPVFMFTVPEFMFDRVENYFLPFRPTLLGFVINTTLYGGISWLLIFGPFVLRRRWRRRHGRCAACGYPNGKSEVCTECGLALKRVASNAAK